MALLHLWSSVFCEMRFLHRKDQAGAYFQVVYMMARKKSLGEISFEAKLHPTSTSNLMLTIALAITAFNNHLFESTVGSWGEALLSEVQADETVVGGAVRRDKRGKKRRRPNWLASFCEVSADVKTLRVAPGNPLPEGSGRKSELLVPAIVAAVSENAAVITDELRSYNCLGRVVPYHGTVCHKRTFGSKAGDHTNNIESTWSAVKEILHACWPRNWTTGDHQALMAKCNFAILLHNDSLSKTDPLVLVWLALKYPQH